MELTRSAAMNNYTPRDDNWLQELLDNVWDQHFADVPQINDVKIEFGRRAKRRLGSIRLDPTDKKTSIITMNGIFKLDAIPEFIVKATLVHELTHYAHGFNSPLNQQQKHPHAGGVMRKEFEDRGLLELYKDQKKWLKENWAEILLKEFNDTNNRQYKVNSRMKVPKPFWFLGGK